MIILACLGPAGEGEHKSFRLSSNATSPIGPHSGNDVDAQINSSAKLSGGGNNTIDVECEISSKSTDTIFSSLSLIQVSALN